MRGAADVVNDIGSTVHGPLIESGRGRSPSRRRCNGPRGPDGLIAAAHSPSDRARLGQLPRRLCTWDAPSQNFVYADTQGNIGYQATGKIPIRKSGTGAAPVDGASGDYDWTGYIPFEEMPNAYNPPDHYIVTANNRVVGDSYPHLITTIWVARLPGRPH